MHESMDSKSYLIDAAIEVLIPLSPSELQPARRTLQHTWKQVKNITHHGLGLKKMVFISWWWRRNIFTECVLLFRLRVGRDPDVTIIYDEGDRSPFRGWHLSNAYRKQMYIFNASKLCAPLKNVWLWEFLRVYFVVGMFKVKTDL